MFLFLSKFLPLFIYPLSLSCILLILAISVFWKRPQTAAIAVALALTVLLLGGNAWIAGGLVRSLEWQNLPGSELPQAAAIVVLGGGIQPGHPPRPWVEVSDEGDRILYGARLYQQGKAPVMILSGGRINWRNGGPPESADMAQIARALGVPATAILQDPSSLNTYENAVNVRQILQSHNIQGSILLVTSALHMPRSLAIFRRQGMSAIAAPADFIVTQVEENQGILGFLLNLIPSAEALEHTTKALREYIGLMVYRLRGWL